MSKPPGQKDGKEIRIDGLGAAAELLNGLDPEHRKKLLSELDARDPGLTRRLESRMIRFEHLIQLSDLDLQLVLREAHNSKLVLALRRAPTELLESIYRNMTARAGEVLRDEVATQGPKRVSDIMAAQADILKIAIRLSGEGRIKFGA